MLYEVNQMERMNYREARAYLTNYNRKNKIVSKNQEGPTCVMAAVISQRSLNRTLEERTYLFTNKNKAFVPSKTGYSIIANNLSGSDVNIRLDGYLSEELNGDWEVEYCYIVSEE